MLRSVPAVYGMNAGILGRSLWSRQDVDKYARGARVQKNFLPKVQGPGLKRSGTRHVDTARDQSEAVRLIPFEFSIVQAYVLAFNDGYFRVYRDGGRVGTVEVAVPYTASELAGISYAQSADVIYLAHRNHPPAKISRTSDTSWTYEVIDFTWEAFQPINATDTTIYASAATGSVTLTASSSIFSSDMVGQLVQLEEVVAAKHPQWGSDRGQNDWGLAGVAFGVGSRCYYEGNVYENSAQVGNRTGFDAPIHESGSEDDRGWTWDYVNPGRGYAEITAFTSGTQVTATVIVELPDSVTSSADATTLWSFGAWNATDGYPTAVALAEDRLWWGGTLNDPHIVWGSRTASFENLQPSALETGALVLSLDADDMNAIEWMAEMDVLTIGTRNGIFTIEAIDSTKGISAGNVRRPRRATIGSAPDVRGVPVDSSLLFIQRHGRKLHESTRVDLDRWETDDLTALSDEEILTSGVAWMDFQREPHRILWVGRNDGALVAFTYDRRQNVAAWHEQPLGGSDVVVESGAVIPHPDGDQDQLWLSVARTINGSTVRYLEIMEKPRRKGDAIEDAFMVDSGITYSGAAATTIGGLSHLEGESVSVLADGESVSGLTVSSGQITLPSAASKVHIGLAYSADFQPMRLDGGTPGGSGMGREKRIPNFVVDLIETGAGIKYGTSFESADLDEMPFRDVGESMDTPPTLFDGLIELDMDDDWDFDGDLCLRHDLPLPCEIGGIFPNLLSEAT